MSESLRISVPKKSRSDWVRSLMRVIDFPGINSIVRISSPEAPGMAWGMAKGFVGLGGRSERNLLIPMSSRV